MKQAYSHGGSWNDDIRFFGIANRDWGYFDIEYDCLSFRLKYN